MVLFPSPFDAEPEQVVSQDRIGVPVPTDDTRFPLLRAGRCVLEGIHGACVEVVVVLVGRVRDVLRIPRGVDSDPARHLHDVADANFLPRITVCLVPLRDRGWLPQFVRALFNEHAHERTRQALAHGPRLERRMNVDAIRIPLAQDPALVGDNEPQRHGVCTTEAHFDRFLDLVHINFRRERLVGEHVAHRPRCRGCRRQVSSDIGRRKVDRIFADRRRYTALVLVLLSRPDGAVREGERHALVLKVDDRVDHVCAFREWTRESAHVGRGIGRVESGHEHTGAEHCGKARGLVMQRLPRRRGVLGREFQRRTSCDDIDLTARFADAFRTTPASHQSNRGQNRNS